MLGAFSRTRFSCDRCASGPDLAKKKKEKKKNPGKRKKHVDANRFRFLKRQYQCCFSQGCPGVQRFGSRYLRRYLRFLESSPVQSERARWFRTEPEAVARLQTRSTFSRLLRRCQGAAGCVCARRCVDVFLCFPSAAGARAHNPIPFISVG